MPKRWIRTCLVAVLAFALAAPAGIAQAASAGTGGDTAVAAKKKKKKCSAKKKGKAAKKKSKRCKARKKAKKKKVATPAPQQQAPPAQQAPAQQKLGSYQYQCGIGKDPLKSYSEFGCGLVWVPGG